MRMRCTAFAVGSWGLFFCVAMAWFSSFPPFVGVSVLTLASMLLVLLVAALCRPTAPSDRLSRAMQLAGWVGLGVAVLVQGGLDYDRWRNAALDAEVAEIEARLGELRQAANDGRELLNAMDIEKFLNSQTLEEAGEAVAGMESGMAGWYRQHRETEMGRVVLKELSGAEPERVSLVLALLECSDDPSCQRDFLAVLEKATGMEFGVASTDPITSEHMETIKARVTEWVKRAKEEERPAAEAQDGD